MGNEQLSDEQFRARIDRHFALYRINLRLPVVSSILIEEWYRVDLLLVNELGLFRRADIQPNGKVHLHCQLLSTNDVQQQSNGSNSLSPWQLETRPIQNTSETTVVTGSSGIVGYEGSGKGGFEYRIVRNKDSNDNSIDKEMSWNDFYLNISMDRVESCTLSPHILPLVIGPIHIMENTQGKSSMQHPTNAPIESWPENTDMVHDIYRLFSHTMVQEYWDAGIPGKIWDSAVVMLEFFKNKMPLLTESQHIVDLSAGTGLLGFYVNNSNNNDDNQTPNHHVTITELEEALGLIQHNATLNSKQSKLDVRSLLWGNKEEANACGKADIIMASDVLYEAEFFQDLVQALCDLSKPTTKIYIGYKRRGLDTTEEDRFWRTCMDHGFKITLLQSTTDTDEDEETKLVPELAQQTGVQIYRLNFVE